MISRKPPRLRRLYLDLATCQPPKFVKLVQLPTQRIGGWIENSHGRVRFAQRPLQFSHRFAYISGSRFCKNPLDLVEINPWAILPIIAITPALHDPAFELVLRLNPRCAVEMTNVRD